ncbi:fasciclin-like protein FLA6 [Hordeum vulgare]|uniref:FAS1 domain-containing protein n=1 Tax=Hordeum vulgare subsp. vulgare TaxID=112509 RepID=A0A8I6X369_HORVV|nr:fasciclin-like arabinogalactan protein 2 [Hordeum vulgare subsp. vulgare]KAE8791630.1 fasciclin-like protein FLA6 [Hordeum vulgare]
MAPPFLLLLLLVVSGGAAAAGADEAGLPRLEFRGVVDSGRGNASVAPEELPFMDVISADGACGRFARLVAEMGNLGEVFRERLVDGGGLTVFCPEDKALAEFEPTFRSLGPDDRLAVLLYHGAAACYGRKLIHAFDWVAVSTLAVDAATNKGIAVTLSDDGDTFQLWPSPPSWEGAAWVTETVSDEPPFAVYVIDAVLLPSHVRRLLVLDGGDEVAGLGWLDYRMPLWVTLQSCYSWPWPTWRTWRTA